MIYGVDRRVCFIAQMSSLLVHTWIVDVSGDRGFEIRESGERDQQQRDFQQQRLDAEWKPLGIRHGGRSK